MVFTLQIETTLERKYFIGEEAQGSPFRLNDLANKAEKPPYRLVLHSSCPETLGIISTGRVTGAEKLYLSYGGFLC